MSKSYVVFMYLFSVMLLYLFKLEIKTNSRLNLTYGNVWIVAYISLVVFFFVGGVGGSLVLGFILLIGQKTYLP